MQQGRKVTAAVEFSNLIREMARQLGVSFQTVNRWENGKAVPSQMAMRLLKSQVQNIEEKGQDLLKQYF